MEQVENKFGKIFLGGGIGCLAFGIMFFLILISVFIKEDIISYAGSGVTYGYNNLQYVDGICNKVITERFVEGNEKATYSLEEYVAGVVQHEVGGFNNLELFKTFAIAARTYLMRSATRNADGSCYLYNSTKKQTFEEVSKDSLAYQAASETAGVVLLDGNGKYLSTEYDAFCWDHKDENNYYVCQKGQAIPVSWVEEYIPKLSGSAFVHNSRYKSHGRGMSQDGAYYLGTVLGFSHEDILMYYYDNAQFGTVLKANSNSVGNPTGVGSSGNSGVVNNTYITDSLAVFPDNDVNNSKNSICNYLTSQGTSCSEYNKYIVSEVNKAGKGTAAGVVAAGSALVDFMAKYGYRLPYYLGGYHGGSVIYGFTAPMDCSGFVSWSIQNAGFKFSTMTTSGMWSKFSSVSCDLSSKSCIGEPGDLIVTNGSGHVVLIVSADTSSGVNRYKIVHAASVANGIYYGTYDQNTKPVQSGLVYKIIKMSSWYNNPANIN